MKLKEPLNFTQDQLQSIIRGDLVELEKLLEICQVPPQKQKQIKRVFARVSARSSLYGYEIGYEDGLNDKVKVGGNILSIEDCCKKISSIQSK